MTDFDIAKRREKKKKKKKRKAPAPFALALRATMLRTSTWRDKMIYRQIRWG